MLSDCSLILRDAERLGKNSQATKSKLRALYYYQGYVGGVFRKN